ncbi:MAG: hypothetical protein ACTSVY_11150 [Candidatus Helarchaeota archaeon]
MAITIVDLIGLGIIMIIVIIILLSLITLIRSYKETKNVSTLYFTLAYILFVGAIVTLLLEKILLTFYDANPEPIFEILGRINAIAALVMSGGAVVNINLFAFHNTFPEKKVILGIIFAILTALYVTFLSYANIVKGEFSQIIAGEITYAFNISLMSLVCLIPVTIAGPAVFYYFSFMTKESNRPNSLRSLWMGIGITLFFIGYILEILPVTAEISLIISIPGRSFLLMAAIILYVCFKMPNWFKNSIGWPES